MIIISFFFWTGAEDTHLRPWCVAARGKWGGRVAGAPGSFRSTVRWDERPWGTGDGRHGWLVVAALAGAVFDRVEDE